MPLLGRLAIPERRHPSILWNAAAVFMHPTQSPLSKRMALLCRLAIPERRFPFIFWDATAVHIHIS